MGSAEALSEENEKEPVVSADGSAPPAGQSVLANLAVRCLKQLLSFSVFVQFGPLPGQSNTFVVATHTDKPRTEGCLHTGYWQAVLTGQGPAPSLRSHPGGWHPGISVTPLRSCAGSLFTLVI